MKINPTFSLFTGLILSFTAFYLVSSNIQFSYNQLVSLDVVDVEDVEDVVSEDETKMKLDDPKLNMDSLIHEEPNLKEMEKDIDPLTIEKEITSESETKEIKSNLPESDGAEINSTYFSIYKTNEEVIDNNAVPNIDMKNGCLMEYSLSDEKLWYSPNEQDSYNSRFYNISIQVESGLNLDPDCLSNMILGILNDQRGWSTIENINFQLVNSEYADLNVIFAEPTTVDELCYPLQTNGIYSCRNEKNVVINMFRWLSGAKDFGTDLSTYRIYLINHEVGHYLGWGHTDCPSENAIAPVMMQQSKSTNSCIPNGWPIYERIKLLYSTP